MDVLQSSMFPKAKMYKLATPFQYTCNLCRLYTILGTKSVIVPKTKTQSAEFWQNLVIALCSFYARSGTKFIKVSKKKRKGLNFFV